MYQVFGSEDRLGEHAKKFTMAGRMRDDPELVFWREQRSTWAETLRVAEAVSWKELYLLPSFPGIVRLLDLERKSFSVDDHTTFKRGMTAIQTRTRGKAAGRWAFALERVIKANYLKRLKNGNKMMKLKFRQLHALDKWVGVLSDGLARVNGILTRLEHLTRFRIFTETRVLICTVDRFCSTLYCRCFFINNRQYAASSDTPFCVIFTFLSRFVRSCSCRSMKYRAHAAHHGRGDARCRRRRWKSR